MNGAIVGSTGFVGGNVLRSGRYAMAVNSANVGDLRGCHFDRVVFAAARAEKWRINQDPEADRRHIDDLRRVLNSFTTDRLVLISTVDVYRTPTGVDESTEIDTDGLHAYGLHRFELEQTARATHPDTTVIRLPGLFGPGLKKNVIYDLIHDNQIDRIHPRGRFQYYDLGRLADDIDVAVSAELPLVNLASEPVDSGRLAREVFGRELAAIDGPAPAYEIRSRHAELFGGADDYVATAAEVIEGIRAFAVGEGSLA